MPMHVLNIMFKVIHVHVAQKQQQGLVSALSKAAKYFSLEADGSRDAGNIKDEVFLAVY